MDREHILQEGINVVRGNTPLLKDISRDEDLVSCCLCELRFMGYGGGKRIAGYKDKYICDGCMMFLKLILQEGLY